MSSAQSRDSCAAPAGELIGQTNELVGRETTADKTRIAMVEVTQRDGSARTEIIVGLVFKQTEGAGVRVTLQVSSYPVAAISQSVREQAAPGIQQQAR